MSPKTELEKISEGWKVLRPVLDISPELYTFIKTKGLPAMNILPVENCWGWIIREDLEHYLIKLIEEHQRRLNGK